MSKKSRILKNTKGMTLVEIMIVLIILGGLMAYLGSNLMGRLGSANIKNTKIAISELGKNLDLFYADCGYYPTQMDDLVTAPADCSNWGPEPYLKKIPRDAWNNEFVYESSGSDYVIKSLGADRREGGSGKEADISSEDI
jgi:general secretion pathway protein G